MNILCSQSSRTQSKLITMILRCYFTNVSNIVKWLRLLSTFIISLAVMTRTTQDHDHKGLGLGLVLYAPKHKQEAQLTLTNPRDAMLNIYSVNILISLHLLQLAIAYCTPSTIVRGSTIDITLPTTAVWFNSSVFHILPPEPHPDCR